MERALSDVTNGIMGVRRAEFQYNIPNSTLLDRVYGRVKPGTVSGPPCYLDPEEEEVVRWIAGCAETGCAKSASEVMAVVSSVVREKKGSGDITVSRGWWEKFQRRHPEVVCHTRSASTIHTRCRGSGTASLARLEDSPNNKGVCVHCACVCVCTCMLSKCACVYVIAHTIPHGRQWTRGEVWRCV